MRTGDHAVGPDTARVTLVEYGDYQCPYCARAYLVLQVVLAEVGDSIRYVFRNYPIYDIHAYAMPAAEAAESVAAHAGEPAFWNMHSILFENQDALEIDDLLGYAEAAGAEMDVVAFDLADDAMRGRVERDIRLGMQHGVTGTPTFFINGRKYDGDWTDADAFTAALKSVMRERAHH